MKMPEEPLKRELLVAFASYLNSQEEISDDNLNIIEILPSLLQLQNSKSLMYGRSYCKHGHLSVFFNLERKWDRIQNIMERVMKEGEDSLFEKDKSSTATETFMDTVIDLGLYSLMWAGYIKERHPEVYQKFLEINKLDKFREE